MPLAIGSLALVGWAVLATFGGGIDLGDGIPGGGPTGAFLALALGAPAAAALALSTHRAAVWRWWGTRAALAGAGGLALWSAASIAWAAAPDLAWIDANRALISLAALVVGIGVGVAVPHASRALGLGITAAGMVPLAVALGAKVFPAVLGGDRDLARLSAPVGYWNAVALIAVMVLPGLLWLATSPARPRPGPWLAGAGIALAVTVLVLTYSRGGIFAAALAAVITLTLMPATWRGIAALAGGLVGALLPLAHALGTSALSDDNVPVALREGPGLGLGWRMLVGMAVASAVAGLAPRLAARLVRDPGRASRAAALACAGVAALGIAGAVATPEGRDWVGDRWAEVRGEGGDAVANDAGRLVNASGNQRSAWWAQAWRGFQDAPLVGHGAGGFRLVHLQERRVADDRLITDEPHDTLLRTMSGLGLVGLALLLALGAGVVAGVRRALIARESPDVALPAAILAAFAMQSAVDWSWAIPALAVPAFAAAGVMLATAVPGSVPGGRRAPAALVPALAVVAVVAAASALMPWWSARTADAADAALARGDAARAVELSEAAGARNPLALGPLRVRARAYRALGDEPRAYGAFLEMTRTQPENPAAWRQLALYLGSDPRATDAWRRVLELSPRDGDAAAQIGG